MKHTMPAVIFAGGKSSRMGKDKALLPFADCNTLSEFQYNKLTSLFDKVYISSKEDKFDFEATVITDPLPKKISLILRLQSLQTDMKRVPLW